MSSKTGITTRGLTPEQLARKRAIDRKSQRGVRERTNQHIEMLEAQVAILSHQANRSAILEQQLLTVSGELEASREEVAQLRSQLDWISCSSPSESMLEIAENELITPDSRNDGSNLQPISFLLQRKSPLEEGGDLPIPVANIYEVRPNNCKPTCLSDRILQDIVSCNQSNPRTEDLVGPDETDLSPLLYSTGRHCNIVSQISADIISRFSDISTLPEQVGGYWVMSKTLNWRICGTEESYNQLPRWLRPLPIQLRVPHPFWMDDIPWPQARIYLIENQAQLHFEEFSSYYAPCSIVSWPYDPTHVVMRVNISPSESEVRINPIFSQHLSDLKNWTVKAKFRNRYPVLSRLILEDSQSTEYSS